MSARAYVCARGRGKGANSQANNEKKFSRSLKMRNNDTQIATECQNSKENKRQRTTVGIKKIGARALAHKISKRCYRTNRQYGVEMNGYGY